MKTGSAAPGPPSAASSKRQGRLFIISAPSGAGKTTLCRALLQRQPDLCYSTSFTTRAPRTGEREGVDYHFIPPEAFEARIADNRWAEWAEVHGNYYGTARDTLEEAQNAGKDLLLDIDVQGARQILQHFPDSISIFIMPPSLEELERRMRARGSDSDAVIAQRLNNARQEMDQRDLYRHCIVNDRLEQALQALLRIVASYRQA